MKVGVATMPRSVTAAVDIARAADDLGFDHLGIGEGPFLYADCYVTVTACMLATGRVPIGPFVTNPVVRHWTAHASAARAFEDLAPGRFVLGIATGDGASRSVGLEPMRWSELEAAVSAIRDRAPASVPVWCTVSGPKGAAAASSFSDCVVVATGTDVNAIRALADQARSAGDAEVWTMIPALVVDDDDDVAAARDAMRLAAYSTAHFAFAGTFASKHVPDEYQPILRECFAGYDYAFHGVTGDANPNLRAFDDHPEVGDYLLDRMVLVGTARAFRDTVERLRDDAALDGITFPVPSPAHAERIAAALHGLGRLER
jgi:alkanesulfonate monooxygenase SsuD/methylene tetrahydromethanopterin reductase-like flavin-dependent oxidoreductase (luciferase family)